jgi:hypothetical protein
VKKSAALLIVLGTFMLWTSPAFAYQGGLIQGKLPSANTVGMTTNLHLLTDNNSNTAPDALWNDGYLQYTLDAPMKITEIYFGGQNGDYLYTFLNSAGAVVGSQQIFGTQRLALPTPIMNVKYVRISQNYNGYRIWNEIDVYTGAPDSPANFNAVASSGQVALSWNASGGATSYNVYRNGVKLFTGITTLSQTVTGLTNNTNYIWAVSASSQYGESAKSSTITTNYDSIPPTKVANLEGTASATSVSLSWDENDALDGVVGYNVYKNGTKVNGAPITTNSYNVTGLTIGLNYTFIVRAVDGTSNESEASDPLSITTKDSTPPAQPVNLSAQTGDRTVNLSWDPNTEPDINGYKIYNGAAYLITVPKNQYMFGLNELTNGGSYTFKVVAVDITGNESVPATITAIPNDRTPPGKPVNLTAAVGNSGVSLFWSANPEPDLKGYYIYRNGTRLSLPVTKDIYRQISGLTNGTEYSFEVSAVDNSGNESPRSLIFKATPDPTADTTPPGTPTGITASANKRDITASWETNADPDLVGYFVYLDGVRATYAPISANTFTISNLEKGKTYSVSVSSIDTSGNESPRSSPVSVSIANVPAPTGLKARHAEAGGIDLTWTNTDPAPDKYLIYRNGLKIAESTSPQYNDTTAEIERNYIYMVSGYREEVESERASASITYTKNPIGFEETNTTITALDLIKGASGYLLLFSGFILLVLAMMFGPQIQTFVLWIISRFRGNRSTGSDDSQTYTIRVKNPGKVQKQLNKIYKTSNYARVLKKGRKGGM